MIDKLEADGINLQFGSRKILSDIYLKCETGRITGLLGRNGSGKTSLMNIIVGNLSAHNKSVRFNNHCVSPAFNIPDLIVYLPQFNYIPNGLTIKRIFSDFNIDFSLFENLFPEFALKYSCSFKHLSGGQRRLVEIYVLIKSSSKFVLLDEPFSHLSPIMVDAIKALIVEEKTNKGFLITDHMYSHIIEMSDDLYVLSEGKTHLTKSIQDLEWLGYAPAFPS